MFRPLTNSLLYNDEFMLLADYRHYVDCQNTVAETFLDTRSWTRLSILNVARMGKFSSDRAIHEYCQKIWNVRPVDVNI